MHKYWNTIENRLAALGCITDMQLRPGATAEAISELEQHLGVQLPASVREFLAVHDGQVGYSLILGRQLLSLAEIKQQWDTWRSIDEEEMNADCADMMASDPEGFIKPMYTNRLWIPLTSDGGGNHIGLDFDPDALGRVGQVIAFGRDEDTKRHLAEDFEAFLVTCISWLNHAEWNGEYLDQGSDQS